MNDATTPPTPPPTPQPVRGYITIAIEGGARAVYAFQANPFAYQQPHPEAPRTLVLSPIKGPEKNHTGPTLVYEYGKPLPPPDPNRAWFTGWVVRGTYNGKQLPTEHRTHDANPLVAVRQWYAKIVGGGG